MDESTEKTYKYSAIMVEPRKHLAYELVLRNFLENLNDDWQFLLFVGNDNEAYVRTIVNRIGDPRVCIYNIGIPNLTGLTYSELFTNPLFYSFIHTEMFLVFQTDSIVNPQYKHLIYEFLDYDYVGAPWREGYVGRERDVGNGGLSLRKKTKMLEIIDKKIWNGANEDLFFSFYPGINKPSVSHAEIFSVESIYNERSFGLHNCWNQRFNSEQMTNLKKMYPLLSELIRLQGSETSLSDPDPDPNPEIPTPKSQS